MKIGNPTDILATVRATVQSSAAAAQQSVQSGAAPVAKGAGGTSSVAVTVSARVRSMATRADVAATSDVDMDKVNAVRAAIANGTYKVDAEAIADKLLSSSREFLSPSRV